MSPVWLILQMAYISNHGHHHTQGFIAALLGQRNGSNPTFSSHSTATSQAALCRKNKLQIAQHGDMALYNLIAEYFQISFLITSHSTPVASFVYMDHFLNIFQCLDLIFLLLLDSLTGITYLLLSVYLSLIYLTSIPLLICPQNHYLLWHIVCISCCIPC